MAKETTYTLKELLPIVQQIDRIVKNPKCKHKAVRKKYTSSTKNRVECAFCVFVGLFVWLVIGWFVCL